MPGATFEVIKDGVVEKRAFAARTADPSAEPHAPGEPPLDNARGAAAAAAPASAETPQPTEARSPSDALAKAASALAQAARKLERAAAENEALRKTLAALAPDAGLDEAKFGVRASGICMYLTPAEYMAASCASIAVNV